MDFLDPKKKRARHIRLMIGHTLMLIIVVVGSYLLFLIATGYNYDRKTGGVIQKGVLYLDSAPDKAIIKINGQVHPAPTNTRLALPGGVYTVEISKEGYRSWKRTFELEAGKVARFSYPSLYLNELSPEELLSPDKSFGFASQSPNRRWIIIQQRNDLENLTVYDLEKRLNRKPTTTTIKLPPNLLTSAEGNHRIELVEWSTDNQNVLVSHKFQDGQEYVVINVDKPTKSYNVNETIGQSPNRVNLYDKKIEKLYLYDSAEKTLHLINVATKQAELISSNVISYKLHGDDKIFMAVVSPGDKTKADIILRQDGRNKFLRQVPASPNIPLEFAQSADNWYAVIGVASENRTYIYKNPDEFLKENPDFNKTFLLTLKTNGAISQVSFSQNSRFILAQSGQNISVYDTETDKRYGYRVKQQFDKGTELKWMDGHRLMARNKGEILVFDFNGINLQNLVPANPGTPVMFDRDYTELYTLGVSTKDDKRSGFFMTDLRLDDDK